MKNAVRGEHVLLSFVIVGAAGSLVGCSDSHTPDITVAIQQDGFDGFRGHDYNPASNNRVSFGALLLGHCQFHDVVAKAEVQHDKVVDVTDYSFRLGAIAILSSKHVVQGDEGGITLQFDNAAQLESQLPGVDCTS